MQYSLWYAKSIREPEFKFPATTPSPHINLFLIVAFSFKLNFSKYIILILMCYLFCLTLLTSFVWSIFFRLLLAVSSLPTNLFLTFVILWFYYILCCAYVFFPRFHTKFAAILNKSRARQRKTEQRRKVSNSQCAILGRLIALDMQMICLSVRSG